MNLPFAGSWSVEVKGATPFAIHGDRYFELQVARLEDPSGAIVAIRVSDHVLPAVPKAGDRLSLSFLMGQVTAARLL